MEFRRCPARWLGIDRRAAEIARQRRAHAARSIDARARVPWARSNEPEVGFDPVILKLSELAQDTEPFCEARRRTLMRLAALRAHVQTVQLMVTCTSGIDRAGITAWLIKSGAD
jgi:hypothetical protein